MTRSHIVLFLSYLISLAIVITLSVCYFKGIQLANLSGGLLHTLARLHVLLVHLAVGVLFFLGLSEIILFFLPRDRVEDLNYIRTNYHILSHFSVLVVMSLGLLMQLIENYPNENIINHLYVGLATYLVLLTLSAVCFTKIMRNFRVIPAFILIISIIQSAHLGGIIRRGLNFFH